MHTAQMLGEQVLAVEIVIIYSCGVVAFIDRSRAQITARQNPQSDMLSTGHVASIHSWRQRLMGMSRELEGARGRGRAALELFPLPEDTLALERVFLLTL